MSTLTKIILLSVTVLLSSCEKWLETSPRDSIPSDQAVSTIENLSSVLVSCYDALQGEEYYGRDFLVKPEVLADNCRITIANTNRFVNEYNNQEGAHMDCWQISYTLIGRTNHIITNIDKVDGEKSLKDRIKGQALFLRALAYHDLVRSYSREPDFFVDDFDLGVPEITVPFDGTIDTTTFPRRDKVVNNYNFIEKDLMTAFILLDNNDEGLAPFEVSSLAVKGLLSRVYLYQRKWEDAHLAATFVINNSGKELEKGDYLDIFRDQSESIFSIYYTIAEALTFESLQSIYTRIDDGFRDDEGYGNDNGAGYGDVVPTESLLDCYEDGDKRVAVFRKVIKGGQKVLWSEKFNGYGGAFGVDYIPVLRLSEMLLTRAEAYSNIPELESLALDDLNDLREARGLIRTDLSGESLKAEIAKQRRVELAFEGHRFFDLKRKGIDIDKGDGVILEYANYKMVARIPIRETDLNDNLDQNPEY